MPNTVDVRGERVIDSRDLLARYDALNEERDALIDAVTDAQKTNDPTKIAAAEEALEDWRTSANGGEWKDLQTVIDAIGAHPIDSRHAFVAGEILIRDDYFEKYAQELAEEMGLLEHCDQWPARCIDWAQAAEELKVNYVSVEIESETYWFRA